MRQAGALSTEFKEVLTSRVLQALTLHLQGPENGASLNITSPLPACLCLASSQWFTAARKPTYVPPQLCQGCQGPETLDWL